MKNKNLTRIALFSSVLLYASVACSTEQDAPVAASSDTTESSDEKNIEQLEALLAIEGDSEYGAYLAGDCTTCHAADKVNGSIPQLHGKDKRYLASALLEYKNKQRVSEVMRGVASALSDEEIAALITYLSEQ